MFQIVQSRIVKWGYQDNFKPVYVFFTKKFHAQKKKHSQANINQQNKIKQTLSNKGNNLSCAQIFKRVKVACFTFWYFSCVRNLFVKKDKQAWNCLDNLIFLYYWRVSLSMRLLRIYLCTFIFICDHLWTSLLIYDHLYEFMSLWK